MSSALFSITFRGVTALLRTPFLPSCFKCRNAALNRNGNSAEAGSPVPVKNQLALRPPSAGTGHWDPPRIKAGGIVRDPRAC